MFVGWGTGYVMPNRHEKYKGTIGLITMGSQFTPVRKVNYTVEATRVGQRTDYERLTLEVWTTGAMSPNEAVTHSAEILDKYVKMFFALTTDGMDLGLNDEDDDMPELDGVPEIRVEEMEFSQRTFNCLRRADVEKLRDILKYTKSELLAIRGFCQNSMRSATN